MKCCPTGLEIAFADAQLDHGLTVHDVDVVAAINEGLSELARISQCGYDGIHHQCVAARIRHQAWMVLPSPSDGVVRPVHVLGDCWHSGVDLLSPRSPTALVL